VRPSSPLALGGQLAGEQQESSKPEIVLEKKLQQEEVEKPAADVPEEDASVDQAEEDKVEASRVEEEDDDEYDEEPLILTKEEVLAAMAREASVIHAPTSRPHQPGPLGLRQGQIEDEKERFLQWVRANKVKNGRPEEDEDKVAVVAEKLPENPVDPSKQPDVVLEVEELKEGELVIGREEEKGIPLEAEEENDPEEIITSASPSLLDIKVLNEADKRPEDVLDSTSSSITVIKTIKRPPLEESLVPKEEDELPERSVKKIRPFRRRRPTFVRRPGFIYALSAEQENGQREKTTATTTTSKPPPQESTTKNARTSDRPFFFMLNNKRKSLIRNFYRSKKAEVAVASENTASDGEEDESSSATTTTTTTTAPKSRVPSLSALNRHQVRRWRPSRWRPKVRKVNDDQEEIEEKQEAMSTTTTATTTTSTLRTTTTNTTPTSTTSTTRTPAATKPQEKDYSSANIQKVMAMSEEAAKQIASTASPSTPETTTITTRTTTYTLTKTSSTTTPTISQSTPASALSTTRTTASSSTTTTSEAPSKLPKQMTSTMPTTTIVTTISTPTSSTTMRSRSIDQVRKVSLSSLLGKSPEIISTPTKTQLTRPQVPLPPSFKPFPAINQAPFGLAAFEKEDDPVEIARVEEIPPPNVSVTIKTAMTPVVVSNNDLGKAFFDRYYRAGWKTGDGGRAAAAATAAAGKGDVLPDFLRFAVPMTQVAQQRMDVAGGYSRAKKYA